MGFYLDASLILATILEEASSAAAQAFVDAADRSLVVSELAAAEVASGLSRLAGMRVLSASGAKRRLSEFDIWRAALADDLAIEGSDFKVASSLVRRFELNLRAPDALHLALCRRGDHDLVTLDRHLARAAAVLGVRANSLA